MNTAVQSPRIVLRNAVSIHSLPDRVAYEARLFEKHGLEAVLPDGFDGWDRRGAPNGPRGDVLPRFENTVFDTWNMCEWGAINRVERTGRPAQIAYLRPAITAQVLLTLRDDIKEPRDLAGVPIGINEFTGNHYATLQLLEGTLTREQISLEHGGDSVVLAEKFLNGGYAAVSVMEPFVSLAVREGARILGLLFYRGAQIFADGVSHENRQAYVAAIAEAVDLINADLGAYREWIVEPTFGQLAPEELNLQYLRYVHPDPYPRKRFEETYAWMQSWGLANGESTYDSVIDATAISV